MWLIDSHNQPDRRAFVRHGSRSTHTFAVHPGSTATETGLAPSAAGQPVGRVPPAPGAGTWGRHLGSLRGWPGGSVPLPVNVLLARMPIAAHKPVAGWQPVAVRPTRSPAA